MKVCDMNEKLSGRTLKIISEESHRQYIQNIFIFSIESIKKDHKNILLRTSKENSITLPRFVVESLVNTNKGILKESNKEHFFEIV